MNQTIDIVQTFALLALLYLAVRNTRSMPLKAKSNERKLVLDTCALIDGRILEIANTGFMPYQLVIPRFVIGELQLLADGQDSHKRERARFGLDIVQALQDHSSCDVTVYKDDSNTSLPTDDRLVITAKKLSADLCTIDYNLNKVATIEGVRVLNVNELAKSIRPVALPGEKKSVKIVQKGSNKDQGVGYMDDGSMVVVEASSKKVGQTVDVEIVRFIQTDAGKMLFARLAGSDKSRTSRKQK
jgi:uncharacterized protein YacL